MPGFTGLPSFPRNWTSIARTLSRASSPPTMWPRGHVSWYSTGVRFEPVDAGTTTHGPGTETQIWSPSHSFAAPAGTAATSAAAATAATESDTRDRHQTPFRRNADVTPPTSRRPAASAAKRSVISRSCLRVPSREPSSSYTFCKRLGVGSGEVLPARRLRDLLQRLRIRPAP